MHKSLYNTLNPYDWYVLWRYFFAMSMLIVGTGFVVYSMLIKKHRREWNQKTLKRYIIVSRIIAFSFGLSFVWANAFFDSPEITGFSVSIKTTLIFAVAIGIGISLMIQVLLTNLERYYDSHEENPKNQKKRQDKLHKIENKLREKLNLTNDEEIKIIAEKKLFQKEITEARIYFGIIFIPILTMFFPPVLAFIMLKVGVWAP